jgi:hypothetical protein
MSIGFGAALKTGATRRSYLTAVNNHHCRGRPRVRATGVLYIRTPDDSRALKCIEGYAQAALILTASKATGMTEDAKCSPGSHPHSDRPNWRKARTFEEYQRNCEEGLEQWSERRAAKLLGLSRVTLWRAQMVAEIPGDLFDRLLVAASAGKIPMSERLFAAIGRALKTGDLLHREVECCPNCGHKLRVRPHISHAAIKIVSDWLNGAEA